jgi:protein-tyrosine phosphatase
MFQRHRVLPLQGASNFRDLGGYATPDGRSLRWHRLFRSDHLGGLTAEDRGTLAALGLKRSFDFRGVAERAAQPYDLPGLAQHSLAIEPSVVQKMEGLAEAGVALTPERMVGLMEDLYCRLVEHDAPQFATLFEHVRQAEAPLVFHCTAGKDRTGIAAALLLLALGVPRSVVLADYLLTNEVYRRPPRLHGGRVPEDALAVLWTVRPAFLDAALSHIDRRLGGLDRYLAQALGLDPAAREELAARYLEREGASGAPR